MQIIQAPQSNWNQLRHILRDYLMSTSIPILFKDLLRNPKVLNNPSYKAFIESHKRDNQVNEAWYYFLKEGLVDVFIHRLLGSQADMDAYRTRSEKYRMAFNDLFGSVEPDSDLSVLTRYYLDMLKDYLCRNMLWLPADGHEIPLTDILKKTREIYHAHRLRDDRPGNDVRLFYIDFEKQVYVGGLLQMTDEAAAGPDLPAKGRNYLVMSEYIDTLFVYVYMVEFVKLNPSRIGMRYVETPELFQGKQFNLFRYLMKVDFVPVYEELVAKRNGVEWSKS